MNDVIRDEPPVDDDVTLRRYLVGEPDLQRRSELEDRYFTDPELWDRLDAAADDLCLDYVCGRLSQSEKRRVDALAANADWRARLEFARAIHQEFAESRGVRGWSPGAAWGAFLGWLAPQPRITQIAFAATALLLALGWPLALAQYWRGRAVEANRAQLQRQVNTATDSASAAEAQLRDQRGRIEELQRRVTEQLTVSFVLVPGATRGAGQALIVPAAATFVRLQLFLERNSKASSYRAVLRRAGDATTADGRAVEVVAAGSDGAPEVRIPASALPTGEYELVLEASLNQRPFEEIASYAFGISRR